MSFFTSIFSNAVSFISSVFFTKEEEQEFDDLYLENVEGGVGELATLVPEVISPVPEVISPAVPPAPAGLVEVPSAEPTGTGMGGIVIVQPAAVAEVDPDSIEVVDIDLLEVHKMFEKIPVYTNKQNDNKVFNITQDDDKFELMSADERSQNTKNKNKYYKNISNIDFCIEIVNPEDPGTYDYILDTNDPNDDTKNDPKLGFINLKMYNTKNLPTPFTENSITKKFVTITKSSININDPELINKIRDALKIVDTSITAKHKVENIPNNNLKTIFLGKDLPLYSMPGAKHKTTYEQYFNLYMNKSTNVISPNVNLVMSYSYDAVNSDNYKISFSYVVAPVKTQKKSLLSQPMIDIISNKLTNSNDCVKNLFDNFGSGTEYNLNNETNPAYKAILTIYDSAVINTTKLQKLRSKPYTLLKHGSLNTYLNILISMLDKPHDIIGGRVAEEVQKYMLNDVIAPNIIAYIKYLKQILSSHIVSGKEDEFNKFIEFVEDMVFTFTNNTSKYVNTKTSYENAIMLFVCKILETDDNINTNNNFLQELEHKFPKISNNTNVVINPDVMYLTSDISDRVNQRDDSKFRKYFSAPEIIDHGHVYNINNNTNIQFPENYKEIQVKDISNNVYFTIHSYSTTTNLTDTSINKLYYNVYVWFTESTGLDVPKCLIKYTIPFMNAPDCAGVYAGYKNIKNYKNIKDKFTNSTQGFNNLSAGMKNLIPFLMLDQFYNAKSLQDDQNQLQVNQITTIPPIPPINADSVPTQFLGLCCDLASAANGFNYYMSRQKISVPPNPSLQNPNSIVGYYHAKKKIWITNNNQIKFEIIAAKKVASKDIFDVLNDVTPTSVTLGGTGNKVQQNGGTITENTDNDNDEIGEYGEYTYYNTMADWLYDDNNFKNKKYDLNKLFKRVKYNVYGKEYISSNCYFDIFSNDFVKKMIEMLKIYSYKKGIKNSEDLKDIIKKCAIYILTKFKLIPDNIYPPNQQIRLSNYLDEQWKNLLIVSIVSKSQNKSIQSIPQTPKKIQKQPTYMVEMDVQQNNSKRIYSEPQTPQKPSDIARGVPQNLKRKLEFNKENNPPNKKTLKNFGGFTKKINKKKVNKKKTNKKRIKRMVRKTRRKH